MSDPSGTGVLSALAPIMHGATLASSDPGALRRGLCGRALARAYLTQQWTAEELWDVAEHLGLTHADVVTGARWTQEDLARIRRKLGITQKLSDPSEMVTT
jgi:ABC-type cobalamin transport system ATPase subunit